METYKSNYKSKRKSVWPYVLTLLVAGAVVISAPIYARAAHLGGSSGHPNFPTIAAEDVRNTLHNLSTSNPISGVNITPSGTATAEVCVFCHTPHGANSAAGTFPGPAPLWNRAMPNATGYTMYNAPNMDAVTSTSPVGVSLACLSCHDGSIALDALINAGGSGGFRGGNATTTAGPGTSVGLITAAGAFVDVNLSMSDSVSEGTLRTDTGTNYQTITGSAEPFPNLTRNLGDDHAISFAMPPGTGAGGDPQFTTGGPPLLTKTPAGNIDVLTRGPAYVDRRDAIRLYPAAGGSVTPGTWVECASCHNPHAPRPLFLRLPSPPNAAGPMDSSTVIDASYGGNGVLKWAENPNSGSAVCLTCHQK